MNEEPLNINEVSHAILGIFVLVRYNLLVIEHLIRKQPCTDDDVDRIVAHTDTIFNLLNGATETLLAENRRRQESLEKHQHDG